MITKAGNSIRTTDERHKFSSALCEYVYDDMDRWADRSSGDAEAPTGYFARVGAKRILRGDERGFVWLERFGNEYERDLVYNALDDLYCAWADEDNDESVREEELEWRGAYVKYVYECDAEGTTPFEYGMWWEMSYPEAVERVRAREEWESWHDFGDVMVCTNCYIAHHFGYREVDRVATDDEAHAWHGGYLRGSDLPNVVTETEEGLMIREWFAGEDDTPSDRQPLTRLDGIELSDNTNSETGAGIDDFSWSSCQGCGSSLGGSRYRLAWSRSLVPEGWTVKQYLTAKRLADRYHVELDASKFVVHPLDSWMMAGYVEGWIGPVFFGIDQNGEASS